MSQLFARLAALGFKPALVQRWLEEHSDAVPWRVSAVDRGRARVVSAPDPSDASGAGDESSWPSPFVERVATTPAQISVAVGDWVALEESTTAELPTICSVVQRETWLRRGSVGDASSARDIAANLDTVFVVAAFASTEKLEARALNIRGIERYVSAIAEGGARAVVLLNKADLSGGADSAAAEMRERLRSVEVLPLSARDGSGIAALGDYLGSGETVAFVGKSGVGKSTLVNRFLDAERQDTGAVRDADAKGKHTTTRREMFLAPSGALLIDTPGMRELALYSETGHANGFDDIDSLAGECRFADCGHSGEPGCAVAAAIERGDLQTERVEHFRALQRDAQRMLARHDAQARHQRRKEHKALTSQYRERQRRARSSKGE